MIDWGASGRSDEYTFHLVDPFSLAEIGQVIEVDADKSGVVWGYYTDNLMTASLTLLNADYRTAERDYLIRIKQRTAIDNITSWRTLGTVFVDSHAGSSLYGLTNRKANCYSTLWRYTQDKLSSDFYRPTGYNVVDEIRELVHADGGILAVGEGVDTSRVHTRDIIFELGTKRSEVLNTIAGWINCQIGIDPDGRITLEPYITPRDRAVSYTFEAGRNCIYLPGYDDSTSGSPINRVVAYYSRNTAKDDDPFPLTDRVIVDLPSGYEFSYQRSGRRRTEILKLADACEHTELEDKATTYLYENCGDTSYIEIQHVSASEVIPGAVVRYINNTDGPNPVNRLCMVADIDMSLTPGGLCKTKLKLID